MKIRHCKPEERLVSEQYIVDEDNCITIPSSVLYIAGLSSDKEFVILERYSANNVYYIVPASFEYNKKEYGFINKVNVENDALKINTKGLFEIKPGDDVTLDIFEFQLTLYDRHVDRDNEEETGLDASKIDWSKEFDKLEEIFNEGTKEVKDPYALDENMRKNLADKCKRLHNPTDYNDLIENPPSFEELDKMFNKVMNKLVKNSYKRLHASKDPLLNEFIEDMLARVYGKDGQKVIMISNIELDQFIDDMTYWYNRIKKGE